MQKEVQPEWITVEDARRLTSLGRTTLWRICSADSAEGGVKTARVGRAVRINRRSLEEYMERASEETARQ